MRCGQCQTLVTSRWFCGEASSSIVCPVCEAIASPYPELRRIEPVSEKVRRFSPTRTQLCVMSVGMCLLGLLFWCLGFFATDASPSPDGLGIAGTKADMFEIVKSTPHVSSEKRRTPLEDDKGEKTQEREGQDQEQGASGSKESLGTEDSSDPVVSGPGDAQDHPTCPVPESTKPEPSGKEADSCLDGGESPAGVGGVGDPHHAPGGKAEPVRLPRVFFYSELPCSFAGRSNACQWSQRRNHLPTADWSGWARRALHRIA